MRAEHLRLVAEDPEQLQALAEARALTDAQLDETLILCAGMLLGSRQKRAAMAVLVAAERLGDAAEAQAAWRRLIGAGAEAR